MNKYFKRTKGSRPILPSRHVAAEPPRRCLSRREGDEWLCPTCGLRWPVGEVRPDCPKDEAA